MTDKTKLNLTDFAWFIQIVLFKVPAHIGIKGNEKTYKTEKQAIDMSRMITTRLPYTNTTWPSGKLETPNGKESGKIILTNYIPSTTH